MKQKLILMILLIINFNNLFSQELVDVYADLDKVKEKLILKKYPESKKIMIIPNRKEKPQAFSYLYITSFNFQYDPALFARLNNILRYDSFNPKSTLDSVKLLRTYLKTKFNKAKNTYGISMMPNVDYLGNYEYAKDSTNWTYKLAVYGKYGSYHENAQKEDYVGVYSYKDEKYIDWIYVRDISKIKYLKTTYYIRQVNLYNLFLEELDKIQLFCEIVIKYEIKAKNNKWLHFTD